MKIKQVKITYCVELTIKEFEKFESETDLMYALYNIKGIHDVDYDGHFGPNVWFSIDLTHAEDVNATLDKVKETIKEHT